MNECANRFILKDAIEQLEFVSPPPNLDNHKKQVDMLLRQNNELIKRVELLRDEIEVLKGNTNLNKINYL